MGGWEEEKEAVGMHYHKGRGWVEEKEAVGMSCCKAGEGLPLLPSQPSKREGAVSLFIRALLVSICKPGSPISSSLFLSTSALERPTSASRATACRLREERVTCFGGWVGGWVDGWMDR